MSKSREPESSLELLLDTMCNTFGGVMFIAIALMVVLSSLATKVEDAVVVDGDLQELTQRLEDLKTQVDTLRQSNVIRDENIKILQNDPRRQMIVKVTQLEKESRDLEMQIQLIAAENNLQNEKKRRLDSRLAQQQKDLNSQKMEFTRVETENIDLENKIAKLKEEMSKIVSGHISFKSRAYTKKSLFFFIVSKQRLWRVGPDADGNLMDDVTQQTNGDTIVCRLNPEASGIQILLDGALSPEVIRALENIPANRAPRFVLDSDSVKEFCVLREYLKKENIPHGISVQFANEKVLVLIYTNTRKDNEVF